MNTRDYLKKYDEYRAELKNKKAERREVEREESLPGGVDYSKDRVQSSAGDGMFSLYLRIQVRTEELDARILWLETRMRKIEDEVNAVQDPPSKRLLHMRYIEMQGWKEICDELRKTYPQFIYEETSIRGKCHKRALDLFAKEKQKNTHRHIDM